MDNVHQYLCADLKKGKWVIDLDEEKHQVTIYKKGSWIKEFDGPAILISIYDIQFWKY